MTSNNRVKLYLTFTLLCLSLVPLLASLLVMDEIIEHSTGLVATDDLVELLEFYQADLKVFSTLDSENESLYRDRFNLVQDQLIVYQNFGNLRQALRDSYLVYYLIIIAVTLGLAVLAAILMSTKISKSYSALYASDAEKTGRIQQLQFLQSWKKVADKIAHEIKNALTPIDIKINSLSAEYETKRPEDFKPSLTEAQDVVRIELTKLKRMVFDFSNFAKLPEPEFQSVDISQHINEFVIRYRSTWDTAQITVENSLTTAITIVNIDPQLFNQVLINLINNAVEANQDLPHIDVKVRLSQQSTNDIVITVENSGRAIEQHMSNKLFDIYYSNHRNAHNSGLGLTIAQKIMLEHNGEITNLYKEDGAAFQLILPIKGKLK